MRLVASLGHYAATRDEHGLQIHQYGAAASRPICTGGSVALRMESEYPWDGRVRLDGRGEPASGPWTLSLRVPGLVRGRHGAASTAQTGRRDSRRGRLPADRAGLGRRRRRGA